MWGSLLVVGGALAWPALLPSDPGDLDVLSSMVVLGLALGIAMTPSTTAITESLDPEVAYLVEEGIGGAYVAAGRLGPDGAAVMTAAQSAFLDGWSSSMWLAAGIAAAAALVAAALIPAAQTRTTENTGMILGAAEVM